MSSNGKLQTELTSLQQRVAELEHAIAAYQHTEAMLRQVQAEHEAQIATLTTQLDIARSTLPQAQSKPEDVLPELADLSCLFQTVVKHTPSAMAIFDTNMCYIAASDRFLRDYNIADQHVIGRNHYELFPDIPQRWKDVHQRCLAGAVESDEEDTFVREDGSITYNRWECRPWYDAHGQIGGMITFTEVITQYKQVEEQLQLSQFILDYAVDAIHLLRFDGYHQYVNDAACARLGYTREELLALHISDIDPYFTPDVWDHAREQLKQQKSFVLESHHRRKDGTIFPIEVTGTYLEFQGNAYFIAFARDITERKQAEEEQQKLITLIENSSDFIGMVTLEGQPVFLNAAGRKMVGIESDEAFFQSSMLDFVVPEDRNYLVNTILPIVQQEGRWEGELCFQHFQTGMVIPTNYNVFLVKDPHNGIPLGFATVTRDITERKQVEAERAALQEQVIAAQSAALRELSTPLIPLTRTTVVMPLIGSLDSARAQQVIETLLEGVAERRATMAILDVTGVPIVDTQVANVLLQAAQAVRLLGAQVAITGIRPEIAQTLVGLGIDLAGILTHSSLQSGIAFALQRESKRM